MQSSPSLSLTASCRLIFREALAAHFQENSSVRLVQHFLFVCWTTATCCCFTTDADGVLVRCGEGSLISEALPSMVFDKSLTEALC